jgi:ABC-type glycerol-3-phosphate transport system permease component
MICDLVNTEDVDMVMLQVDANQDQQVSFEEFVDSASFLKTEAGISTDGFNKLLRMVAKGYVGKGDDEVRVNVVVAVAVVVVPIVIIVVGAYLFVVVVLVCLCLCLVCVLPCFINCITCMVPLVCRL